MKLISLLRGINVSGQKKIKMIDLQSLYVKLGLIDAVTYIQTGNIIYGDPKISRLNLINQQEKAIENEYHFQVPVDIRSHNDFEKLIKQLPFNDVEVEDDLTKILVTFLREKPNKERCTTLLDMVKPPEKLIFSGSHIYIYCPNGYGKSKLTNKFIEGKLKISATTRNWKTVLKLHELST